MTREKREQLLKRLAIALRTEFPGCTIEVEPTTDDLSGTIRVVRETAILHRGHLRRKFLDDTGDHIKLAPEIARQLRATKPEGEWINTEGLLG